jgi:UDP-glucose 4-epimerase
MAVLVTGGAGYIGSVNVEQLLASGERVVVLDNFSTGHRDAVSRGATLVEGDIHDKALLGEIFSEHGVDTVMHFAASIVVPESCAQPGRYFGNNFGGALSVLDAMVAAGIKHFILSSTAAAYGDPAAAPITEDMANRPLNPYGLSKLMVEQALEWYDRAHGLRSVRLRYFNAAGASAQFGEAHEPESHLIPNVFMAAEGLRPALDVFGDDYDTPDGTCVRDYIHILDLADAHARAMAYLRNGNASQVFNLGNSTGHSVLEVIEAVKCVTGLNVAVNMCPRRPGDADRLVASSTKARVTLGWNPMYDDIETIVGDAWAWRKAHPHGYEK